MISLAVIENISEIRDSLVEYFKSQNNFICETAVESIDDFLKKSSLVFKYDIILLDISLPGINGTDAVRQIKEKWDKADIVLFTVFDEQDKIFQALCAGASGYILKNTPFPKIKEALEECNDGGASMSPQIARKVLDYFYSSKQPIRKPPLTEKEKQVVAGLVNGLNYKMIAAFQNSSLATIRHHIKNIYEKIHLNYITEITSKY